VRFFFDNNLSTKLAKSLHVLVEPEHQVVHLKDRFAANTPDETWMAALAGEPDWIIVSGDLRIRRTRTKFTLGKPRGTLRFF
jgi:predicted nuclease of predicted toxin-antitoxin system